MASMNLEAISKSDAGIADPRPPDPAVRRDCDDIAGTVSLRATVTPPQRISGGIPGKFRVLHSSLVFTFLGTRERRALTVVVCAPLVIVACLAFWVQWGNWPDPRQRPLPWKPEVILILGGGDEDRIRQGSGLADQFPEVPVIVTGDGGSIVQGLIRSGLPTKRIKHEMLAKTTIDNARLTILPLDQCQANRVALVTNWFHVPRALAVFRKLHPEREFAASFEPKPESLTPWDRGAQRRERLAAIWYLLRYQVWSW